MDEGEVRYMTTPKKAVDFSKKYLKISNKHSGMTRNLIKVRLQEIKNKIGIPVISLKKML
ncbi:MAG: hypothetical protein ACE5K0_00505 [Candidatus Methanofastidiosia archaeon]